MARYRKKPIEIDAVHYGTPEDAEAVMAFLGADCADGPAGPRQTIVIRTLEGLMSCPLGHWAIRGIQGEHYSCEPNIFAQTYEAV